MTGSPAAQVETTRSLQQVTNLLGFAALQATGLSAPLIRDLLRALTHSLLERLPEQGITSGMFFDAMQQIISGDTLLHTLYPAVPEAHRKKARLEALLRDLSLDVEATGQPKPEQMNRLERGLEELRTAIKTHEAINRGIVTTTLRRTLPLIVEAFGTDVRWRRACYDLLPDNASVKGVAFARAARLEIERPQIAASYLKQVDDMARWIVHCARANGFSIPDSDLRDPPSFSDGRLEPSGAIGIEFNRCKIQLWTPFGTLSVCELEHASSKKVIAEIWEQFQPLALQEPSEETQIFRTFRPRLFLATRDATGASLPIVVRRLPEGTEAEKCQMISLWDQAKPATRRAVGEAHLLAPEDLARLRTRHEALASNDLGATDADTRLAAFRELVCAGRDFLPRLLEAFASEDNRDVKHSMFHLLVKYEGLLMGYPRFGDAVTSWLSANLPRSMVAEEEQASDQTYRMLNALRDVGPIAPETMIPLLTRTLDLFSAPEASLTLLAMYGKAAAPAVSRMLQFLNHPNRKLRRYVAKTLVALEQ